MSTATTDHRATTNARLAQAMGYKAMPVSPSQHYGLYSPDGRRIANGWAFPTESEAFLRIAPDFFTDAAASRALCEWITRQSPTLQDDFGRRLLLALDMRECLDGDFQPHYMAWMLTAPLPVIAEAAAQAIEQG